MALQKEDVANFETLKKALANGHVALVECKDAKSGDYRAVICAIGKDGDEHTITPFGHLCFGNPFEEYLPPDYQDEAQLKQMTRFK